MNPLPFRSSKCPSYQDNTVLTTAVVPPHLDMADSDNHTGPSINVNGLNYKFQDGSSGLTNVSLSLPAGSRTLLIGGDFVPSCLDES
jgi:hypothetical protein